MVGSWVGWGWVGFTLRSGSTSIPAYRPIKYAGTAAMFCLGATPAEYCSVDTIASA